MRIGIYGGTFDPIHYGHLRTALEVGEGLALDQVRLLPCHIPAHRAAPGANASQRRAMIELALADGGDSGLRLDDRELLREGPSYMVDTLQSFKSEFPSSSLYLILGTDAFVGLERWSRWEQLFDLSHIVVMGRPGSERPAMSSGLAKQWADRNADGGSQWQGEVAGRIYSTEVTQLAISATRIRELMASGRSARYLLPDAVIAYIRQQGLYGVRI